MHGNISAEILKYKDEMLEDIIRLVRIPSIRGPHTEGAPFGEGPKAALEYCVSLAENMGLKVKNIDGRACHIEYGMGEGLVGVLAHCDVVPAGDGWTFPPFGGEISGGRIYGRGTMDDKGPAIAAIYCLKAIKDLKIQTKRRVRVIIGASEESGMEDMDYYFANEEMPDWAFSPDSEYPVCNREKGILQIKFERKGTSGAVVRLEAGSAANIVPVKAEATVQCDAKTAAELEARAAELENGGARFAVMPEADGRVTISSFGKSAHASTPEQGVNAAAYLILLLCDVLKEGAGEFLNFLNTKIGLCTNGSGLDINCEDEPSGQLTLNLGMVHIEKDCCGAITDIRYPVTVKSAPLIESVRAKAAACGISAEAVHDSEPLYVKDDSELVKKLCHAYKAATGTDAGVYSTGGGTYARVLGNRGVAFGAGVKPLSYYNIHSADEFLDINDFMRHSEICLQAIYELACN